MANDFVENIRKEFPILNQTVNQEPLIYFDNAATSQTPMKVLDRILYHYQNDNANVHRGVHSLGQRSTNAFEQARETIANFIGVKDSRAISFSSGTTASLNHIAKSLIEPRLKANDSILITRLEHHSNLVPWQEVCQRTKSQLVFLDLNSDFQIDLEALNSQHQQTPIKALVTHHISNVLGVEQPIQELIEWAHDRNILVVIDGAQAAPHLQLKLTDWEVDAYAFSSHKLYGPMGLGVTYLHPKHLREAQPTQFGGEMIHQVEDYQSSYKSAPWKFEAGTQAIAQIVGLEAAIEWVQSIGFTNIQKHEAQLGQQLYEGLKSIQGINIYTTQSMAKHGIISFNIGDIHPHDAATAYDQLGIALRAGHHCAQPLMRLLQVPATLRASLMVYNTSQEVNRFIQATQEIKEFFNYGP